MKKNRPSWNEFLTSAKTRQSDYETRKRNCTLRFSYAELRFVEFLQGHFGAHDVVHHPPMVPGTRHQPDVWIISIETYVEFDGVYWHGLDRPYVSLSPLIKKKYDRDRALDAHCAASGISVVRITDNAWDKMGAVERLAWCEALHTKSPHA